MISLFPKPRWRKRRSITGSYNRVIDEWYSLQEQLQKDGQR
jgi:hypothetical protein